MERIFVVFAVAANLVMIYAFIRVVSLNKKIPGGTVGKTWKVLTALIALFMLGYLSTPFFHMLPVAYQQIITGVIFLAGAVFVVIVINLFYKVVSDLGL
jgi:hypothetical protein